MVRAIVKGNKIVFEGQASDPSGNAGDIIYNSTDKDLKLYDGSDWGSIGAAIFAATAKTGDYTITASDCTGFNAFSNDGATSDITFTLPTAAAGLQVTIINVESKAIIIDAGSGDMIYAGDLKGATSIISIAKGDSVILHCINATEWICSVEGIWNFKNYGFFGGGDSASYVTNIQYLDTTITSGNSTDGGDLTEVNYMMPCARGPTYGFWLGGYGGTRINKIDQIDVTVLVSNATNVGTLLAAKDRASGVQGSTYGFCMGGGVTAGNSNVIEYIQLNTVTQNGTDVGDITVARKGGAGVSSIVYGFNCAGSGPSNVIEYIDLTTTVQDATDTGNLIQAAQYVAGIYGTTYGFICGGYDGGINYYNTIGYIDLSTTSQSGSDRGDLTESKESLGGSSGNTYGFIGGGEKSGPTKSNVIEYIDLSLTVGNAADRGDLIAASRGPAGM